MFFARTFLRVGREGILFRDAFSKGNEWGFLSGNPFSRDIQGRNFFLDTFLRVGKRGILSEGTFLMRSQGGMFFGGVFLRVGERWYVF